MGMDNQTPKKEVWILGIRNKRDQGRVKMSLEIVNVSLSTYQPLLKPPSLILGIDEDTIRISSDIILQKNLNNRTQKKNDKDLGSSSKSLVDLFFRISLLPYIFPLDDETAKRGSQVLFLF